ncbi:hypothetical protein AB0D49_28290 [Streptomyces sp. NPDC048290]|uniref:hypothetical protein n=1 Tax=Streptomyces sp. NPDC048290 TaxID=3155811 RepID=UPI003443AE38
MHAQRPLREVRGYDIAVDGRFGVDTDLALAFRPPRSPGDRRLGPTETRVRRFRVSTAHRGRRRTAG